MADYKVIDAEQLDADLTTVADAIRSKGGTTEQLLFPSGMVTAIGAIQSGGGSMENGEFTTTSSNYYNLTIPVSSKKSHLIIYSKDIAELISNPNLSPYVARHITTILAIENKAMLEMSVRTGYNSDNGMTSGDCFIYDTLEYANNTNHATVTFNDDSIQLNIAYSPFSIGNYYWFAW